MVSQKIPEDHIRINNICVNDLIVITFLHYIFVKEMNKIKEKGLMADKFFSGKIYEMQRSCSINFYPACPIGPEDRIGVELHEV